MTEITPYRRNAWDDDKHLTDKAKEFLAVVMQDAIDEELEVTQVNIGIIRRHLADIALQNNGVVPIKDVHKVLDKFLRAEI